MGCGCEECISQVVFYHILSKVRDLFLTLCTISTDGIMKYALVAAVVLQSTTVLGNLLPVHFKAPSAAHFLDIVHNDTYDLGCRPKAVPTEDGHFTLHALLTEDQIAHLNKEYEHSAEITLHRQDISKRATTAPIGSGDRFQAGAVVPSGLGTKTTGSTIGSIMNVNEINSAVKGLVNAYGVSTVTLPYKTFNGATQTAAYVGAGTDKTKYKLYLSAGMHARERGGPDQLIYWISDLLAASKAGTGLKYGSKSYTNAQVKSILAAGIVFFPLVNPDGVAYDQAPAPAAPPSAWTSIATSTSCGTSRNTSTHPPLLHPHHPAQKLLPALLRRPRRRPKTTSVSMTVFPRSGGSWTSTPRLAIFCITGAMMSYRALARR
jgi:hypothetical protein